MSATTSHPNTQPIDFVPVDRLHLSAPTRPVVAEHLRIRAARLSQAIPSIERIVDYWRGCGKAIPESVWPNYAAAMVELAAIRGELGVLDPMRIERLADTMACSMTVARSLWDEKKSLAEGHAAEQHARAVHKLSHTGAAKVWHVELVDLMDVSVAFDLRAADKRDILGRGRHGLPTVKGPAPIPSWRQPRVRYTIGQLKDWCRRLGFSADTISANARTLSEAEFHARIAKRESDLLPPHKLEGKKRPEESDWHASRRIRKEGPKTRKRAHGVTAERRDLAAEMGVHPDTVKKATRGWTIIEIAALKGDPAHAFNVLNLSLRGRSTPDKSVRSTPDKSEKIGHFSLEDVTDHADAGDADPRTDGRHISAPATPEKATRRKRGPYPYINAAGADEGEIIHRWYAAERNGELTEEAARKWHERGSYTAKLIAACEWMVDHGTDDDLKRVAEAYMESFREAERERRQAKRHRNAIRSGRLAEIAGISTFKKAS